MRLATQDTFAIILLTVRVTAYRKTGAPHPCVSSAADNGGAEMRQASVSRRGGLLRFIGKSSD